MGKLTRVSEDLRPLRQSAMKGDHSAAKSLLRIYGFGALAAEVKPGLPFSPRVCRQIDALTAGTGEGDEPGLWEHVEADGTITNDVQHDPPRRASPRVVTLEDEEILDD
jgi:hypothetical protein